jgi:beta-mannosidase
MDGGSKNRPFSSALFTSSPASLLVLRRAMRTLDLNDRTLWTWRQVPSSSTSEAATDENENAATTAPRPCSQFPSQIHAELQAANLIPDPFLGRNEEVRSDSSPTCRPALDDADAWRVQTVQCVGERDWIYEATFELKREDLPKEGETAEVVFEGLDTFATVYGVFSDSYGGKKSCTDHELRTVNGDKVLEAENMHRQYRFVVFSLHSFPSGVAGGREVLPECLASWRDTPKAPADLPSPHNFPTFLSIPISSSLRPGHNTLYIVFHSAFRRGRELEQKCLGRGEHWPCWNGDPSRLFVRKAGYNYGWDWGPVLMTGQSHLRCLI